MAKTGYLPGDSESKQVWYADLYDQVDKLQLLSNLEGGRDSVIHRKNDLNGSKGGIVNFGLVERLDQGFLPSGTTIEGNEGSLTTHFTSITIEEKNMAIRDDGPLTRQSTCFDLDDEHKSVLARQVAENIDREYITALQANQDIIYYEVSGTATLTATLATAQNAVTATDKLSPEMLTRLKNFALSYRGSGFSPLRPVDVGNGEKMLILLTNHDALSDMENDSTFVAAQQHALMRAKDNPLFKGAYAVWRNVIIFATDNGIQVGTATGGNTQPYVRSHLLGAQALCSAWVNDGMFVSRDFDYGREMGHAYLSMWETQKSRFTTNSGSNMTHGSIDVITARSALTSLSL